MTIAIKCIDVGKNFGKNQVLKGVNLEIQENKIYGLLGRNGAGKTTLLNIITTQYIESSGKVKIYDEPAYENAKMLEKLCFIKEDNKNLQGLKVRDTFKIAAAFYKNWDQGFCEELINKFNLDTKKRGTALSKGMQSVVGIIIGLASRAPITIYDEAYLGLDAAARKLFYDILLKDYLENARTIIFSTHLIDEVSNIFENIIILKNGQICLNEKGEDIRNKAFHLIGKASLLKELVKNKRIINNQQFGSSEKIAIFDELTSDEKKILEKNDIDLSPMSLQDFFIYMTDKDNQI